ncbi:MAG: glycosyltransferase [Sedimentisphaerales bacterium]|nr:glycosyltransferase [Sedimentisphaerales bacterium]
MRVLVIISNPKRASFRQRIAVHLDKLRSHKIDCTVRKLPSGPLARRKLFQKASNYDCVILHKKALNYLNAIWLRRYGRKIIYDFDDAIMYDPSNPEKPSLKRLKAFQRTVSLADMVIAGNNYLAEHARKFNGNVHVLPTGLDTKPYLMHDEPKKENNIRLVWIGSRSTLRYLADIKPALEEIGARFDNVVLRIICDHFFDLKNIKVEKHAWSLKTQVSDLITADIGLAPLPDNRFTRGKCGFKILQYAAAGLPIVTSPVGVNSEYVIDDKTGFQASSIPQWIEKITELIENAELRKKMGAAGSINVEKYDVDVIGEQLCALLDKSLASEESVKSDKIEVSDVVPDKTSPSYKYKVSICIPTYNRKEYLRETIDSILSQTYKDFEIVIVDDGSTDGTENILKNLDVPVTYYWQENSGDAAARNKLIELAQGRYISFIDSDDLLIPDAIERMVEVMDAEGGNVIVYGSYFRIDKNGKIYGRCKRRLYSGSITRHLFETILVHACGSLFPTAILRGSPAFDTSLHICSDYELWLRLSMKYRFIALPDPTFKRRRHSTNLSKASLENCLTEFQVIDRFYNNNGGKEIIPEAIAAKVLSKKKCRAGRYAVKEGLYDQACELLSESFRQYPSLKSAIYLLRAKIARKLASS